MLKQAFIALTLILLAAGAVNASSIVDPGDVGVGARPLGMGKAFLGISNDGSGIFINPSGLANIKAFVFNSMTASLMSEYNYVVSGVAFPNQYGVFGLGYINVGTGDIPLTGLTGGRPYQTATVNYNNSVAYFSYARQVVERTAVGGNFKYYAQSFTGGGTTLEGGSGTGIDLDLAASYHATPWLALGAIAHNVLPATMGGKFKWGTGEEESIPFKLGIGSTFKLFGKEALREFRDQELTLCIDTEMSQRPMVWHLGMEWWPATLFALRLGVDQNARSGGIDNNFTGGVGVKYAGFTFDYAYHQYGDMSENNTHYFSLGYVGLDDEKTNVTTGKMTQNIPTEEAPAAQPPREQVKVRYQDVTEDYFAADAIEYMTLTDIMSGYNGFFRPESPINRAELAATLTKAKGITAAKTTSAFSDVPEGYWGLRAINAAVEHKLMGGYPDGTFEPRKNLTRAEAVVVLLNFDQQGAVKKLSAVPYTDIPEKHWASRYIAKAQELGWLDYITEPVFLPDRDFTRGETAYLLYRSDFGQAKVRNLLVSL